MENNNNKETIIETSVQDENILNTEVSTSVGAEGIVEAELISAQSKENKVNIEVTPSLVDEQSIDTEINSAKLSGNEIDIELTLFSKDDNKIEIELSPSLKEENEVNTELTPSLNEDSTVEVELTPSYIDDSKIEAELTPSLKEGNEIEAELTPSYKVEESVNVELSPSLRKENKIEVELTSSLNIDENINIEFTIPSKEESSIEAELTPSLKENNILDAELVASVISENGINSEVVIALSNSDITEVELTTRRLEDNSKETEFITRALDSEETEVELSIRKNNESNIESELQPRAIGTSEKELYIVASVADNSDLDVLITTNLQADSEVEAEIRSVYSNTNTIDVALLPRLEDSSLLLSTVAVATQGSSETLAEILPYLIVNNDKQTEFKVSRADNKETKTEISIPSYADDSINIEVFNKYAGKDTVEAEFDVVAPALEVDVEITVVRADNSELETEVISRLKDNSEIRTQIHAVFNLFHEVESEIFIMTVDSSDVDTEVRAKVDGFHKIPSMVTVILDGATEILSEVSVWAYENSQINSELYTRALGASYTETELVGRAIETSAHRAILGVWGYVVDDSILAELEVKQYGQDSTDVYIYGRAIDTDEVETLVTARVLTENDVLTQIRITYPDSHEVPMEIFSIHRGNADVRTEIYLSPNNAVYAKYKLYAVNNSEHDTEFVVKQYGHLDTDAYIYARAYRHNEINTDLNIMYRGNSDIFVEIQPIGFLDMPTEIEIRPHNTMFAIYEIIQPEIITTVFNPIKDAFTRESKAHQTINYGGSSSMLVGAIGSDINRSFVEFDLGWVNPSYILTESKLRLFYTGIVPDFLKLEILNANKVWSEYSITHLNRPEPIDLITNEYTVNEKEGYVEFDVYEIVQDWLAKTQENNGFLIRVANESQAGQVTFKTRESLFPPQLITKYYDSTVFSHGRSTLPTEIQIFHRGEADKRAEIEVTSTFGKNELDSYIRVHRIEEPLWEELDVEFTVNAVKRETHLSVAHWKDSTLPVTFNVRVEGADPNQFIDVELDVNKPKVATELYIPHYRPIDVEIEVRVLEEELGNTLAEINVSRPIALVEITPAYAVKPPKPPEIDGGDGHEPQPQDENGSRDLLLTDIIVRKEEEGFDPPVDESGNPLPVPFSRDKFRIEITVTRKEFKTEISVPVRKKSNINAEIEITPMNTSDLETEIVVVKYDWLAVVSPKVTRYRDLYTEIEINKSKVHVEFWVAYSHNIPAEIDVIVKSDVKTFLEVTKPDIEVAVTVQRYEDADLPTEIFSSFLNDVPTEINAKQISQVETIIDIKAVSQVDAEIIITKKYIETSIVIPTWADLDIPTDIQPRVLMVNNVEAFIYVGDRGGAYAFIM